MRKLTLRSIWTHKRRLISTVLSVVLGVAFLSGTFVFADTLNKVFDDLFANANEKVDARVQGEVIFSASEGGGETRARLPMELVDQITAVDGVGDHRLHGEYATIIGAAAPYRRPCRNHPQPPHFWLP